MSCLRLAGTDEDTRQIRTHRNEDGNTKLAWGCLVLDRPVKAQ